MYVGDGVWDFWDFGLQRRGFIAFEGFLLEFAGMRG